MADTLLTTPGGETYMANYGDEFTVVRVPFSRSTQVAVGPDRIVAGHTDRLEYRDLDPRGELSRVL